MRRLTLGHLGWWMVVALAVPAGASAQAPAAPAAASDTAGTATEPHSLFDDTGNQFLFGGRATHIDGDPARFQRYQDLRGGVLFTNARLSRAD